MNIKIVNTKDKSRTLYSLKHNEHYHSLNGALSESEHIFINLGLRKFSGQAIKILEIGYGTGLNSIVSYIANKELNNIIYYHGIDNSPVDSSTCIDLKYSELFDIGEEKLKCFYDVWNLEIIVDEKFTVYKEEVDFNSFIPELYYNIIYFDAFSPDVQPEMWGYENLKKITDKLSTGGLFVTYCSKGIVKQNLRDLGLQVKRYSGPAGKRHVVCAVKK